MQKYNSFYLASKSENPYLHNLILWQLQQLKSNLEYNPYKNTSGARAAPGGDALRRPCLAGSNLYKQVQARLSVQPVQFQFNLNLQKLFLLYLELIYCTPG